MTRSEELTRRQQAPGYFAVETKLTDRGAIGDRYLCHAENDREALRMAGRLTGARTVHGFDYFRLDLPIRGRAEGGLPAMGMSELIGAADWPALMEAHEASKAAFETRLAALKTKAA